MQDDRSWATLQCSSSSETQSMLFCSWNMRHIVPRIVVLFLFQGKQAADKRTRTAVSFY